MPRGGYEPDRNNLAPRVGFAWTLDQAARTVLRGGYGIYYNQGALATSEGLYFNPPYFNLSVYFPDPRLPPLTLADPFPASFPVFIPQSATAYQRDLQTPWMEHWNVNVQRQLGASRAIEIAYVGSRGHDLISARDMNQPAASPVPFNLRPESAVRRHHADRVARLVRLQRAADQVSAARGAGIVAAAGLHLGKSTDDASGFFTSTGDPNFPQNSLDPGAEHGRSSFDVRHRFSGSFAYELPLGNSVWLREMGGPGRRHHPERAAVHRRPPAGHRQQQHRPVEPRVRLQRSPERHRRPGARTHRRRSAGSTRRRSRCRRSARSAMPAATSSIGPGYAELQPRGDQVRAGGGLSACSCAPRRSTS